MTKELVHVNKILQNLERKVDTLEKRPIGSSIGNGSSTSFGAITGNPSDNTALVTYLAANGGLDRVGTNVHYLSKVLGTLGTADLSEGSQTFGTDYSAQLQNLLNTTPDGRLIIVDGKYAVKGIKLPSNTWIHLMAGCGFILPNNANTFLLSGTNQQCLTIENENIIVDGPGTLNCNGWHTNYTVASQSKKDANGDFVNGVRFFGVKKIILKDFTVLNARNYAILIDRWEDVIVDGVIVNNGGPDNPANFDEGQINCDGIDLCGYGNNALVTNCYVHAQDDHYTFAPVGDAADNPTCADGFGIMTNVRMINNYSSGGRNCVRIIAGDNNFRLENFVCDGLYGTSKLWWLIASSLGLGSGVFKDVTFRNIDMNVKNEVSTTYTLQSPAIIQGIYDTLTFENISGSFGGTFADSHPFNFVQGTAIETLNINNFSTKCVSGDNHGYNVLNVASGVTITNLVTTNIRQLREGTAYTHLINNTGAITFWSGHNISLKNFLNGFYGNAVGEVRLSGVDYTKTATEPGIGSAFFNSTAGVFSFSNYRGSLPAIRGTVTNKVGDAFLINGITYDLTSDNILKLNLATATLGESPLLKISNSYAHFLQILKLSGTYTPYKIFAANDMALHNTGAGDISILNDIASGNIKMAAGASATPHFVIGNGGQVGIGAGISGSYKLLIDGNTGANSDVEILDTTKGFILKAPNGARYRITVDNAGTLVTTSI